jgi:hypothetical protein
MKTPKSFFLAMAFLMQATTMTFGQSNISSPVVRILPHNQDGFVRLLYVAQENEPVTVKFYHGNTLLKKDRIKSNVFEKGFIKLYDVRGLNNGEYELQIESNGKTVACPFVISSDQRIWEHFWNSYLNQDSRITDDLEEVGSMAITNEN